MTTPNTSLPLVPFEQSGTGYTLVKVPSAIELRDNAIKEAKAIVVSDEASKLLATQKAAFLKGLVKDAESCRVLIKAPAKEFGEKVDAEARLFKQPAEVEVARLESSIAAYIRQQEEIARKAREEEAARARKAQEEEAARQRQLAEAQRQAQEAENAEEREKAAAEAARLEEEALQREMDAAETAPAQPMVATPGKTKVTGGSVKRVPRIFVHDVHALYAAHPGCVKLTESLPDIKSLIRLLESQNKPIEIPGVEVSFETDVAVRATKTQLSLQ